MLRAVAAWFVTAPPGSLQRRLLRYSACEMARIVCIRRECSAASRIRPRAARNPGGGTFVTGFRTGQNIHGGQQLRCGACHAGEAVTLLP